LHLSEIYDLFLRGHSSLQLDPVKLKEFCDGLNFQSVDRVAGYLEYVQAVTRDGIEVRYYEDGLYVLDIATADPKAGEAQLSTYFEQKLSPAISYIFSLGAPTPKVLANIKTVHPTVISVTSAKPAAFKLPAEYGEVYSTISAKDVLVHKTPHYIVIVASPANEDRVRDLVEMQIFFREFKDQLEKYLNVHRTLWEEIAHIKEQKAVRGNNIGEIRSRLDGYEKTVSLIGNRINQMGTYSKTRSSIAKSLAVEDHLRTLFQFKFEVLDDTLAYIKELWAMTIAYLKQAVAVIVELQAQSTARGIQSLQFLTSLGVVSGLIGYFARNALPAFTWLGAVYFVLIVVAAYLVNRALVTWYRHKTYRLKFGERTEV
jgi:hypothetical protein